MGRATTQHAGTGSTTGRPTARAGACLGTIAVLVSACGGAGTTAEFAEPMAVHASFGDVAFSPASITATLPSVRYVDGEHEMRFSDLAVAGRFTGWEPGGATDWSTGAGREVAWTDPADIRRVVLTLQVDEVLAATGAEIAGGDEIEIVATLPGDADAEAAGAALAALDDVVVLAAHRPGEQSDEWWIGLGGVLLGDLDADGHLSWPVRDAAGRDLAGVADDVGSLAALRSAAQAGPRTITVP